jgi:hypothetical protein
MTIAHSLGGSFATAEGITFTRIGYGTMQLAGDRALAELPLGIEFRFEVDGIEMDLVSYCRTTRGNLEAGAYHLGLRRRHLDAGTSRTIATRRDTRAGAVSPSYRFLAWYFHRQGPPLADDLLGDDRPGPVARHYAANAEWLTSALATSDSTQTP